MTTIAGYGEFELIDRLVKIVPPGDGVALGPGDDAALVQPTEGHVLIATTDAQVEGTHFRRDGTSPDDLGWRALAVNLSDVAAMGGRPRWALVSLVLPSDVEVAWLDKLYEGLAAIAREHCVGIVGGNVARTGGPIVVDVTVLGEVVAARALQRARASVGDAIYVTGWPGDSRGGLDLILEPELRGELTRAAAEALLEAHRRPRPRVAEGQRLAASGTVTSCIDVSDGLAADLRHVLAASGVGATLDLDALPVSDALAELAAARGRPSSDYVLGGGEAYELLFTCANASPIPATRIGTIEVQLGLRARDGSQIPSEGHDHFR